MTLSEFIMDNTNDGRDTVRVLVDVMNGFIRGVKVSHQLTAARLLTIYGYQDARDFMDENVLHPSDAGREWVMSDPELSRLIRARTNDGGDVCLFLIDVMHGEVEGIRIGHRVSAARELLTRAFGRSQGLPLPIPPPVTAPRGTIREIDQQVESAPIHSEPVEGQSDPPVQTGPDQQVASVSVRPRIESGAGSEPVEGQVESAPVHPVETPQRRESVEGQPEPALPEGVTNDNLSLYRAASRCIDPNFDPVLEVTDDDYFLNYDGCNDISCPYHGDPEDPDYDPNAHHY